MCIEMVFKDSAPRQMLTLLSMLVGIGFAAAGPLAVTVNHSGAFVDAHPVPSGVVGSTRVDDPVEFRVRGFSAPSDFVNTSFVRGLSASGTAAINGFYADLSVFRLIHGCCLWGTFTSTNSTDDSFIDVSTQCPATSNHAPPAYSAWGLFFEILFTLVGGLCVVVVKMTMLTSYQMLLIWNIINKYNLISAHLVRFGISQSDKRRLTGTRRPPRFAHNFDLVLFLMHIKTRNANYLLSQLLWLTHYATFLTSLWLALAKYSLSSYGYFINVTLFGVSPYILVELQLAVTLCSVTHGILRAFVLPRVRRWVWARYVAHRVVYQSGGDSHRSWLDPQTWFDVGTSPFGGIYRLFGITPSAHSAMVNDFALFLVQVLLSKGDPVLISGHWASLVNVMLARGVRLPSLQSLDPMVVQELWRRFSFLSKLDFDEDAQLQTDSGSNPFGTLKDLFSLLTGEFSSKLISLVSLLCGIFYMATDGNFSLDQFFLLEESFKKRTKFDATVDTLTKISECVSYFFTRASMMMSSGDIGAFLSTDKHIKRFTDKYEHVVERANVVMNSGDWWEQTECMSSIEDAIACGRTVRAMKSSSSPIWNNIATMMDKLGTLQIAMSLRLKSAKMRAAPFCVKVHGGTAQRKSTFVNLLRRIIADRLGIPDDVANNAVHYLSLLDGFDNCFSSGHWLTIIDELGKLLPNKSEIPPEVALFLQYSNNLPFIVPKAFQDKGMCSYNARAILATTNVEDMNVAAYMAVPMATHRRFNLHLTIVLKEEFKGAITDASDCCDMWEITVRKPIDAPAGGNKVDFVSEMRFTQMSSFIAYFNECLDKHEAQQRAALQNYDYIDRMQFCPRCKANGETLPVQMCNCTDGSIPLGEPVNGDAAYGGPPEPRPQARPTVAPLTTSRAHQQRIIEHANAFSPWFWFLSTLRVIAACTVTFLNRTINQTFDVIQLVFLFPFLCAARNAPGLHDRAMAAHAVALSCVTWGRGMAMTAANFVELRLWAAVTRDVRYCTIHTIYGYSVWVASTRRWKQVKNMCKVALAFIAVYAVARSSIAGVSFLFSRKRRRKAKLQGGQDDDYDDHLKQRHGMDDSMDPRWGPWDPKIAAIRPLSRASLAQSGQVDSDLSAVLEKSVYRCKIEATIGGQVYVTSNNAIKLSHGCFVISNHAVPTGVPVKITFSNSKRVGDGSLTMLYSQDEITRCSDKDLAIVHAAFGEASSIEKFMLNSTSIPPAPAAMFTRRLNRSDSRDTFDLKKIEFSKVQVSEGYWPSTNHNTDIYPDPSTVPVMIGGVPEEDPINGDCGGPLVVYLGTGKNKAPVVAGIHTVAVPVSGYLFGVVKMEAYSTLFTRQDIESLKNAHLKKCGMPIFDQMARSSYQTHVTKAKLELVQQLHPNNMFRHLTPEEPVPKVIIYGQVQGSPTTRFKSAYEESPHKELIRSHGFVTEKCVPRLKNKWGPNAVFVRDICDTEQCFPGPLVHSCARHYQAKIERRVMDYRKLSLQEAVNGTGRAFEHVMAMASSAGMGNPGPKSLLLVNTGEIHEQTGQICYKFIDEVYDEIDEMVAVYKQGMRAGPIFAGALKDEVISPEKMALDKIRTICMSQVAFTVLVRQYLLTFASYLQRNRAVSELAVGISAQSVQWDSIRRYLVDHRDGDRSDRIFAGDFKAFDKKVITGTVLHAVCTVIWNVVHPQLPSDDDKKVLCGILNDLMNPLIMVDSTLFMTSMNPSGNPLTVIINCIGNSIMMRAAYVLNHPALGISSYINESYHAALHDSSKVKTDREYYLNVINARAIAEFDHCLTDFEEDVAVILYGDDNCGSVSKRCTFMNQTTIAAALFILGVEYTNADKSDPRVNNVDFINIADATFLKRRFDHTTVEFVAPDKVTNELRLVKIHVTLAPLEEASLAKMISFFKHSKVETRETVLKSSLSTFLRESAQHGRVFFERAVVLVKDIIKAEGLGLNIPYDGETPFVSFDNIMVQSYLI